MKMDAINKLLLIIMFSHITKTDKTEKESNFHVLTCKDDICKTANNLKFQKTTGFDENEFFSSASEKISKREVSEDNTIAGKTNAENVNNIVEDDLKFGSPILEMTELYGSSGNIEKDHLEIINIKTYSDPSFTHETTVKNSMLNEQPADFINLAYSLSSNASSNILQTYSSFETTTITASPKQANFTDTQSNSTSLFAIQKDVYPRNFLKKNAAVCVCDLRADECDINCCCDEDCTPHMKQIFSYCKDLKDSSNGVADNFCFSSKSIFKNNAKDMLIEHEDGLFCIVKNNFKIHLPFNEAQIIKNVTHFQRRTTGKKLFSYFSLRNEKPKISNTSYQIGDYLWSVVNNSLAPFGVPQYYVNKQCNFVQNIRFLTEYSTECLYSTPGNRNSCEKASQLGMNYFLKGGKIIKSPLFLKNLNSSAGSDICGNKTCAEITTYICNENVNFSGCIKASSRPLLWDGGICKNIVSSIEYRLFHNGTEGIKEIKTYFSLANLSHSKDSYFLQKITLKYFWVKTLEQAFVKSGNPGYVIGKPVMAGKKVFSNNETSALKKEAIDLSLNPENWLSVAGNRKGMCTLDKRQPLNFGEEVAHSCYIALNEYQVAKKKCLDLQEAIFTFLIGPDYVDIKSSNRFNKYVATFGNSKVEETGDWVQVIIDMLPFVSSQVSSSVLNEITVCKDVVTELFIDIAYSRIGSFKHPQNKILGVHFYFGLPKTIIFSKDYSYAGIKSSNSVKISTFVQFIDLTTKPEAEFAETPGFEAKFPHDFFYPFFSTASLPTKPDPFIIFCIIVLGLCQEISL